MVGNGMVGGGVVGGGGGGGGEAYKIHEVYKVGGGIGGEVGGGVVGGGGGGGGGGGVRGCRDGNGEQNAYVASLR